MLIPESPTADSGVSKKRTRVQLDLSDREVARLKRVRALSEDTSDKATVLRALTVYEHVVNELETGNDLLAKDGKTGEITVFKFLLC
jgi:hypothetical protein